MNFTPLFILSITSLLSITGSCSSSNSKSGSSSHSLISTSSDGSSFESKGDDKSSVDSIIEMTKSFQRKLAKKMALLAKKQGKEKKKSISSSSPSHEEEEEKSQDPSMAEALNFKNYVLFFDEIGNAVLNPASEHSSSDDDGSCLNDFSLHSGDDENDLRRKELLKAERLIRSSVKESSDEAFLVDESAATTSTGSTSKGEKKRRRVRKFSARVVRKTFGSSSSASLWSSDSGNLTTSFEDFLPKVKGPYTKAKSTPPLKAWIVQ